MAENVLPPMHITECTAKNQCHTVNTNLVFDMNWRWKHNKSNNDSCDSVCKDNNSCSDNCSIEGMDLNDYNGQGVSFFNNNGVKMKLIPGSRLYMLNPDGQYHMFKLKNKEISIDIDVSSQPCGVNSAMYFVEMQRDGGMYQPNSRNKAGPKYGTGYCDAQCPKGPWTSTGYDG